MAKHKKNLSEFKANEISEEHLVDLMQKYNNTWHSAIDRSPNDAWENPSDSNLIKLNAEDSKYSKNFKELKREKFEKGEKALLMITPSEQQVKINPRYQNEVEIVKILENDSYLVKHKDKI